MGKLTYVARKIEGLKTGQVLSKDLKKRIPPGLSARSTARDPTLEIDLSGKEVTDKGFAQFIDDLIECITYRDDDHPEGAAKVTELHFQGNQLTVQSLAKLGEVVAHSTGSLRELDISRNEIEIVNPGQMKIWQRFLESFQGCYLLKKLDLGHNPLRSCGIEILARIYIQSEVDFLEAEAEEFLGANSQSEEDKVTENQSSSLDLDFSKENEAPISAGSKRQSVSKPKVIVRQNGRGNHSSAGKLSPIDLKRYSCTRGLRSIPYIILSNVPMTSASAVHISSIVAVHRNPEHLLEFLPAGKTPVLPDTEHSCIGLIWSPSKGLGQSGRKMLEMAEVIRQHASVSSDSDEELSDDVERSSSSAESTDVSASKILRQQQKKRDFEYSRVSRRVRVEALGVEGVHSAQLWRTALRMMVVSRALLLEDKDRVVDATPEEEIESEQEKASEEEVLQHERNTEEVGRHKGSLLVNNSRNIVTSGQKPHGWGEVPENVPLATGRFYQGSQAFGETFPALRTSLDDSRIDHPSTPQEQIAKETRIHQATKDEVHPLVPRSHTSRPGMASKPRPPPPVVAVVKKQNWRFGLPFEFWRRIIADGVGANGILDREQQTLIMRYASDWDAVAYELGVRGALENEQIWKILDTVHCFTYSPFSGDY